MNGSVQYFRVQAMGKTHESLDGGMQPCFDYSVTFDTLYCRWATEPWGVCSKPCGGGKQKRFVHCLQMIAFIPPQTLFVGGILFSRCPSVRASVRPSVRNALFP